MFWDGTVSPSGDGDVSDVAVADVAVALDGPVEPGGVAQSALATEIRGSDVVARRCAFLMASRSPFGRHGSGGALPSNSQIPITAMSHGADTSLFTASGMVLETHRCSPPREVHVKISPDPGHSGLEQRFDLDDPSAATLVISARQCGQVPVDPYSETMRYGKIDPRCLATAAAGVVAWELSLPAPISKRGGPQSSPLVPSRTLFTSLRMRRSA